jgi:hypothetical protein
VAEPAERVGPRRYRVVAGLSAWRIPVLTGICAIPAVTAEAWWLAVGVALAGGVATALARGVVIQVGAAGLSRGLVLRGVPLGWGLAIPWRAIVEVHTDWCRPHDDSALQTTVRGRDGTEIRLSSAMGLGRYWACLADIVASAPWAVRSGLTEEVLAEGPPTRRHVLSAAAVAGALALVLAAMAGIHYAWSQGRSYLSRYLEETGAVPGPGADERGRDWPAPRGPDAQRVVPRARSASGSGRLPLRARASWQARRAARKSIASYWQSSWRRSAKKPCSRIMCSAQSAQPSVKHAVRKARRSSSRSRISAAEASSGGNGTKKWPGGEIDVGLAAPHLPVRHDPAPSQHRQGEVPVDALVRGEGVGTERGEALEPRGAPLE